MVQEGTGKPDTAELRLARYEVVYGRAARLLAPNAPDERNLAAMQRA